MKDQQVVDQAEPAEMAVAQAEIAARVGRLVQQLVVGALAMGDPQVSESAALSAAALVRAAVRPARAARRAALGLPAELPMEPDPKALAGPVELGAAARAGRRAGLQLAAALEDRVCRERFAQALRW